MAQLPMDEAVQRFKGNEERFDSFVNDGDTVDVTTRTNTKYPTIQKALRELFENGGIAGRFGTLVALQESPLVDGDYALVADDSDDINGIYIKEGGAWRKTSYDYAKMIRTLLNDYYNDKVITPEWVLGSLDGSGRRWNEPKNRMRLKNGPVPAPYERITVECLNPDLEVVLCAWDDEGGFSLGRPYRDTVSKLVKQGYSVIARYKDERPIILSEIKDTDIRITKMSALKTDIDGFKNKVDLLDQWFAGVTYKTLEWESGSLSSLGQLTNTPDRLITRVRNAPYQEKYTGKLRVRPNHPAQKVCACLYDENGDFVRYLDWTKHLEVNVDGFYALAVAWDDFSPIVPSEADLIIEYLPKNISFIEEIQSTVESNSQAILDYMVSGTFNLNGNWEVGSFASSGYWWDKVPADRLRLKNNVKYEGYVEVFSENPDMSVNIVEFDEEGNFIRYNTYAPSQKRYINGYFNVLVRWNDDRLIYPTDADITFKAGEDNTVEFDIIKAIVLQGDYPTEWEVGSITGTGVLWDRPDRSRLRMAANSIKFNGTVYVESLNPNMSINIVEFDEFGKFIKYNSYVHQQSRLINGYFNVLVRWNDDRKISVDDAQVKITLNKSTTQANNESVAGDLNWFEQTPQFSSVPFGHLLNRPLGELQTAFDDLVSRYPYQSTKEVFGRTGDDLYDMHAYTLEPPYPEACIAITMHTHGNERWNPLGFFALLDLFGKNTPQHRLITWLRDKVKWYVVPFMSPRAVADNRRETRGINLNRNFDFLFNETPDGGKGSAPYSLPEAQNIYDFFVVRKDEIMFHLDLHDIPQAGGNVYSHNPAHHRQFVWLKEQKQMQKHLAGINNGRGDTDYAFENGSVLSLFLGVFAIPSVTPEHVTQWWVNRGLNPDQQIAKALEQTCGFLYMFKHMLDKKDTRNSAFYTRDLEVPFASLASGHISWSKQQVKAAFNEVGFLPEINSDGVFVNEGSNSNKSILLITGMHDDDNNSDLTALRVVQQINSSESVYVNLLKDCKLIVAPAISDGLTESGVNARITSLINKYQPKYTVLVEAPKLGDSVNLTRVETSNSSYLTRKTKEANYGVYIEQNGYAENLSTRYTHFKLANEAPKHAIYPHTVANWVRLILNDMASYYAEV